MTTRMLHQTEKFKDSDGLRVTMGSMGDYFLASRTGAEMRWFAVGPLTPTELVTAAYAAILPGESNAGLMIPGAYLR